MNSIKVRIIGMFIITTTLLALVFTALLFVFEYSNLSKYFLSKFSYSYIFEDHYPTHLVDDGYYNHEDINRDPYSSYTVQYIHPYFMFSLPWRTEDRAQLVSSVVTINPDGFRNNPNNVEEPRTTAVLLGGSTAFGHFSSSDETTIASVLSKTLNMNVVNRNAPSWNSHQELVALAKYFGEYSFSISLSLTNDIHVACQENTQWDDGLTYLDSPESFITLQDKINDIRVSSSDKLIVSNFSIKGFARSIFPDTYKLLWWIKFSYFTDYEQSSNNTSKFIVCSNVEPYEIALSFLQNQTVMNQLASARNATHIVFLQPDISLFDRNKVDHNFRNSVYDIVMNSQYCATNVCVDMRNTRKSVTVDELYNGNNISTALFADPAHLTDRGVFMYSKIIAEELSKF